MSGDGAADHRAAQGRATLAYPTVSNDGSPLRPGGGRRGDRHDRAEIPYHWSQSARPRGAWRRQQADYKRIICNDLCN